MPFLLVDVEDLLNLSVQRRIDLFQPLRNILVHGAFADEEFLGAGTNGCFVFYDIFSEQNASVFDISDQDDNTLSVLGFSNKYESNNKVMPNFFDNPKISEKWAVRPLAISNRV